MRTAENFSIVCGTAACNADCPFCVSKMTGLSEIGHQPQPVNWRNFDKAAQIAKDYCVDSVVITGKGEPTLFPNQITDYLTHLQKHNFPLIDLQTNGLLLDNQQERFDPYLRRWYDLGLSFVSISIVHYLPDVNRSVYTPTSEYIDLPCLVNRLHQIGFSVRFSVTLFLGGIDDARKTKKIIDFAKNLNVEQLTLRRIAKSAITENLQIGAWTASHLLPDSNHEKIRQFLEKNGRRLLLSGHNSIIYDVAGQNVCLTNALTLNPDPAQIRQVIFFPNGRIRFDWQSPGATLL